jgi:hypothetical protein
MADSTETTQTVAQAQQSPPDDQNIPPIRLSDPAAEFIDNRIDAQDHRAFSITSLSPRSIAVTERSVSAPALLESTALIPNADAELIYHESDIHQKQFLEALETFEKSLPDKYKTKFDIRGKHTWEEVIEEVQAAETKYRKKGSDESAFSKIRGCFRKLEGRAAAFETFLELIPSHNNYASPIAGSFKLIIRASTRMNEIRDFTLLALATIPEDIERAQLMLEFNQDLIMSPRLHKRISELYISILSVLQQILQWLERNSGIKHFKVFVQQSSYEKELEGKIEEFKRQVRLVKEEGQSPTITHHAFAISSLYHPLFF